MPSESEVCLGYRKSESVVRDAMLGRWEHSNRDCPLRFSAVENAWSIVESTESRSKMKLVIISDVGMTDDGRLSVPERI